MAISIKGIPVYRISHFPIFGQTDIDPYHSVGSSHIFLWFPIDMQWYVPYTQHLQFIIYNYICIFFFNYVYVYICIYICVYIYYITWCNLSHSIPRCWYSSLQTKLAHPAGCLRLHHLSGSSRTSQDQVRHITWADVDQRPQGWGLRLW